MTRDAALVTSFAPVADARSRILILGSMPGTRSLQQQQYYAHPRNAFWTILGRLLDFDPALPYPQRINALRRNRIALWDVLQCCARSGSLDSAIQAGSRVPNDFEDLFRRHPGIRRVCFNGREAATSYERLVSPGLADGPAEQLCLPSTSPANATLSFDEKLRHWSALLQPTLPLAPR